MDEVCSCVSAKKTGHVIAEASPGWRVGRETEWLNKAKPEPSRQNESPTPCQIPSFRSLHLCCKVPQRYYFQYLLQVRHSCGTRSSGKQPSEKRGACVNFNAGNASGSFFLSRRGAGIRPRFRVPIRGCTLSMRLKPLHQNASDESGLLKCREMAAIRDNGEPCSAYPFRHLFCECGRRKLIAVPHDNQRRTANRG